jgi:hypothetical protein
MLSLSRWGVTAPWVPCRVRHTAPPSRPGCAPLGAHRGGRRTNPAPRSCLGPSRHRPRPRRRPTPAEHRRPASRCSTPTRETVAVLETTVSTVGSAGTRASRALCEHGRADLGDHFVDRQATSRRPLAEAGHLAVEITPSVVGGHRHRGPCEHRDSRSSPCRKDQRPSFCAGTGSVPSRNIGRR